MQSPLNQPLIMLSFWCCEWNILSWNIGFFKRRGENWVHRDKRHLTSDFNKQKNSTIIVPSPSTDYLASFSSLKHGSNVQVSYPGFKPQIHDQIMIEAVSFWVSVWIWPKCVNWLLWALVASPMLTEIWMPSVPVIVLFLKRAGYQPPAHHQPGGPGDHTSSGLYPLTCSA